MTVETRISFLYRRDIGQELLDRLIAVYPEGQCGAQGHGFEVCLPADDPRIPAIQELLARGGRRPWADHSRALNKTCEYHYEQLRSYGNSDWDGLPLLELAPSVSCPGMFRCEENGFVKLHLDDLDNSADFAKANVERYVVPERTKRCLENANLKHVMFRPTLLCDRSRGKAGQLAPLVPWDDWGPPWWEITSDYRLPPVSPAMELLDPVTGQVISRGNPDALYVQREGFYQPAELHYLKSELPDLDDFDLAQTFETFGGHKRWDEHTLIASRRFYEFCRDHDLRTDWVPVRVDPG